MKPEKTVEELLRWRFEQARAGAAPAPGAPELLELARPWWEKQPEMFRSQVEHLSRIQVGYDGPAVPALIVRGAEESEGLARVLEFNIRNDNLRFRFQMEPPLTRVEEPALDLTFVSVKAARPLLSALAFGSMESGYLLDWVLLPEIARDWSRMKEAGRLHFRLILRYGL